MKKNKLVSAMAGDNSLGTPGVNWNAPTILPPTPASRGPFEAPVMDDAISALLIMSGCTAKWSVNFWLVQNRAGDRAHLGVTSPFEEWHEALKKLAGRDQL